MMKLTRRVVCLIAMIFGLCCFSSAETTIKAVRVSSPPIIDGKLTDSCWTKAKPITDFKITETNKPAKFQTQGYILYDDNNLYIGMKCLEPNIKKLKTTIKKRDGEVYKDDSIEIMLDPLSEKKDYFHFIVNTLGTKLDRFCREGGLHGNKSWNSRWKAVTFVGKDYWSCEMVFPFYIFEITPKVTSSWRINLCRNKRKPFENSSIAEKGAFNVAGRFAKLDGLDTNFRRYCYKVGKPVITTEVKDNQLNVEVGLNIDSQTGKTQKLKLGCWLIDPNKKPRIKSSMAEVVTGKKELYKVGTFALQKQGEYDCYISLKDTTNGNMVYFSETKIPIKYVPLAIKIIDPFYRDAIFATQNLKKVVLDVKSKLDKIKLKKCSLEIDIRKENTQKPILSKLISNPLASNRVEFDVKKLPYGNLEVFAIMKDKSGEIIAETKHRLQKLPYKKGEAWFGRDQNWHIDGKPFFLNMSWGYPEDMNPYYNVCWGRYRKGKKRNVNMYYSTQINAIKKTGKLNQQLIDFLIKKVKKHKDNPELLAYHVMDEPALSVKSLEATYNVLREADPYHPVFLSHNNVNSFSNYINAADLHTFHCYPTISKDKRVNDLSRIPGFAKGILEIAKGKKYVGFLDQAFNYGDYGKLNERIHTYQEARSKMLLALTCGAKGLLFFNRTFLHYPELYIGAPHLAQETRYLGKAIIAPDSKLKVKASHNKTKTLLKDVNGELYLFVSNVDMKPRQVSITVPGISKYSKVLNVISEDRKVKLKGDSFTDKFDTFETHVYTTSKEKTGLLSVKEICKKIEKVNKARRKPGNLAFQNYERDGVILSASSSKGAYLRKDNMLWHVVDGITDDKIDRYYTMTWCDKTPNKYPDWFEIKLPKKHNIGRVVVYPFKKSLKDYSIQALVSGKWMDVDKVSGKNDKMISHTFKQVNTDKIRVWVTGTNGPNSRITEIEVYEK